MNSRTPSAIICADWGKDQRKRAVYIANVADHVVSRLDGSWTFDNLLRTAAGWSHRGPVVLTFDAPLGIPASWLSAFQGAWPARKATSFPDVLLYARETPSFFDAAASDGRWGIERPFFSIPAGEGSLKRLEDSARRAGVDLYREIDRMTGARTLFARSGIPGSVGSATCALWKEIAVRLTPDRTFRIWPFEGEMDSLLNVTGIAVGEIYPRAAYASALLDIPYGQRPRLKVAKTDFEIRQQGVAALQKAKWLQTHCVTVHDLDQAVQNEDDFDACLSAAALLRNALEGNLDGFKGRSPMAEGGMLGTSAIDFSLREQTFGMPGIQTSWSKPTEFKTPEFRPGRDEFAGIGTTFRCPIDKCARIFVNSRGGWDAHVGSLRMHPEWHPEIRSPEHRKAHFRQEFPEFFTQ